MMIGCAALGLLILMLLVFPILIAVAVTPAAAAVPLAPPSIVEMYKEEVDSFTEGLADRTSPGQDVPTVRWQELLVVEAVSRKQQLERLRPVDVHRRADQFVEEVQEEREECRPGPTPEAPPECETITVTWYRSRSFDEVLARLRLSDEDREWAAMMLEVTDFTALEDVGADCVGPNWNPRPTSGWVWPVPESTTITSCYGPRVDPVEYVDGQHHGLDVGAPQGARLLAATAGQVAFAGRDGNYGNVVRIAHENGILTVYAHMSRITVQVGDAVEAGDLIGYIGSTGKSTGPHLHMEIRRGGSTVDPLGYFK